MVRLSAVIITFNEERNVARCLDSLSGVADEIVVVDSGSTDRTRELCEARGARVVQRPFDGFTTQKNFALDQAAHDHVLSLDADESLSPELVRSIQAAKVGWTADAYTMNRLNFYGEKPIRSCGWYPDRKVRLWDRRRGRWAGGLVHETVALEPSARVAHLDGDLLHRAYERAGQLVAKMQAYSELWAREKAGRRRVGPLGILAKTAAAFFKAWVLKGGIRDGYEGLVVSASIANGVFYNHAKLLEANRQVAGAPAAPHVCPWWIGYVLANPLRKLVQDPGRILAPWVRQGMTVLEPGPGMGFFTLELARRVGPGGRVVAVDLEPRMLASLRRRAARADVSSRIDAREAGPDALGVGDLAGKVDLVLAFALVHELPDAARFFAEVRATLAPGGKVLVAEPAGHVAPAAFEESMAAAERAGLRREPGPMVWRSHTAVLTAAEAPPRPGP